MMTSNAPVSIGHVALTVNDLDLVSEFYQKIIGLNVIGSDRETAVLGSGETKLLELRKDSQAQRMPYEAGLDHTAFLLPTRNDLGLWLRHANEQGIQLQGTGDHIVSEAVYISDPEGNGIEIYRDRPRDGWVRSGDSIQMGSDRLDVGSLAASASGDWNGAPDGTVVGHVHLQVGDVDEAGRFFTEEFGMKITMRESEAGFYGSGGYHHHLAANMWQSRGAGQRSPNTTGVSEVFLLTDGSEVAPANLVDPWGTCFTVAASCDC